VTFIEALKAAVKGGDWITPYAMSLVIDQWVVAGIDKGEGQGEQSA
jgi:hypothetical protein